MSLKTEVNEIYNFIKHDYFVMVVKLMMSMRKKHEK